MLEALIAILIVSLGVLGTVGLYARSLQGVDDARMRGEAALLVNGLVGQMWVSDAHTVVLKANFDDSMGGPGYVEFATTVAQRLPYSVPPVVTITPGPTVISSDVLVTIQWRHPNDPVASPLRTYVFNATIGGNT